MVTSIHMRHLVSADLEVLGKKPATLSRYLDDQASGRRFVSVAECDGVPAGFVTVLWKSDDPVLRDGEIPEVSDLWVLQEFRNRGVGSALLDEAERHVATRAEIVGLSVGLHSGYGSAQRLYVHRGYMPDGAGVVVDGETVPEGATIRLDDDPVVGLRMTKVL
jgi:GNAT superfamily N-acetyltransferase